MANACASFTRMYLFSLLLCNVGMKTIDQINRENLALLVSEYGGVSTLADQLERGPSQVSQWLNASLNSGTGKPRGMRPTTCRYIESKSGKPPGWMDADHSGATGPSFSLTIEDADLSKGRKVPIVGTVQGGDDGFLDEFEYPAGHGDGEEMYYGRDPNTYALRVRGDSMADRIMSGDRIIVEPNTPPQSGDIAVVVLKDGRKTVKKWLYIRADELHLAPFNREHKQMTIPMENVQSMHKVVQIIPR